MNQERIIELKANIIPPTALGERIGPRAILLVEDPGSGLEEISDRAFVNAPIAFRLDSPGGLSEVENADNWGVGLSGYNVRELAVIGVDGRGVRIGIADSGIDPDHPAFTSLIQDRRLIAFAEFGTDGKKIVQHDAGGALIPDEAAKPAFTHWHGTFCASELVGVNTDGKVRGIAPKADLAVARVLQNFNNGTVASIYSGLAWLADQKCEVVSLSLGWEGLHDEWATPIQTLLNQGSVIVCASGNSFGVPGVPPSDSPANYPISAKDRPHGILISVGAIDINDHLYDGSGGGLIDWSGVSSGSPFAGATQIPVPRMVAPGVGIISAAPGNRYRQEQGTSMATAHVAGLIAAVLQKIRTVRADAVARDAADMVLGCLTPLGVGTNDPRWGGGKVNFDDLLAKLKAL